MRESLGKMAFLLPQEGIEKHLIAVIPAKAGIPKLLKPLDSRLRGNDSEEEVFHESTPSQGRGNAGKKATLFITR